MKLLGISRVGALAICVVLGTAHVAYGQSPITQITNNAASDLRPAWSPDGQQVAFQSNRNGPYQVYVVNIDGSDERVISDGGEQDDRHPAWRPDGNAIAVDSGTAGQREIWTVDLNTGARTQVTNLGGIASFPSWSPDGTRISFYAYEDGALSLWVVPADGGAPQELASVAAESMNQCTFACHAPSWSPDGQRIAYASGGGAEVWTMRLDGGNQTKMSPEGSTVRSNFPVYLPDGSLVYVEEHVTPGQSWTDMWLVRPGTNTNRELMLGEVQAQGPFEFSPDGQELLFASPRSGSFDIFHVALSDEGREALKVKSADTEPAAGLTAVTTAGHPAGVIGSEPVAASDPAAQPVAAEAAPEGEQGLVPSVATPFLIALLGVIVVWIAVELLIVRRRRRTDES